VERSRSRTATRAGPSASAGRPPPSTTPVSNAAALEDLSAPEHDAGGVLSAFGAAQGDADPEEPPDQDRFSTKFNEKFRSILHVFGEDAVAAASRGPTGGATLVGQQSGECVSATFLRARFTTGQREKLERFIDDNVIPDRLFNGDDVGASTAQERILISGRILTEGTYRPGTEAQRLYARMCGHWANLVMTYAGASNAAGRGVREQFDHAGNLSLSTGGRSAPGERRRLERMDGEDYESGELRPENSRFRHRGLDRAGLDGIAAGDWIWYYNDNGGGGGNHSVIFSRWSSAWMSFQDPRTGANVNYRRAICFSQRNPSEGGIEHDALLGDHFTFLPRPDGRPVREGQDARGSRICTVTNVSRVAADANPVRSASDLRRALGTGRDAADNERFIQGLLRGRPNARFEFNEVADLVRAMNRDALQRLRQTLADRMSEGQADAIASLNAEALRVEAPNTDLTTLVRLNGRLRWWNENAIWLGERDEDQRGRVAGLRARAERATGGQRAELAADIREAEGALEAAERDYDAAAGPVEAHAEASAELRRRYRQRAGLRGELRTARQAERAAREEQARAAEHARVEAIRTRLRADDEEVRAMEASQRAVRPEVAAARARYGAARRHVNGLNQRLVTMRRTLARLEGQSGVFVAHNGTGDNFNGGGEDRVGVDGSLRNLSPQPQWSQFVREEGS
jgi:hypothetical protein